MPLHPLKAEWDADLLGDDPLSFPGYEPPAVETVRTGATDHYALIEGRFDVLGGTMGAAHGEKVVRAFRRATAERLPVVIVTSSGGARLQEGMVALVQMARTTAAASDHARAGLMQIVVHRSPTTGGVYASYGSLGDLHAASPGALIGFAGPRVVEQLLETKVDASSHSAEAAYAAGRIDALIEDDAQGQWIERALGLRRDNASTPPLRVLDRGAPSGDAWAIVQAARDDDRASGRQWAEELCDSWVDLRGTDPVVRAGLAYLDDRRLVVVALDRHAAEGRPSPDGYELARRAYSLADRLGLPALTFVDTPGAEPGPDAERSGIAREIATTFALQSTLQIPTVSVCVGEGGSGGALAFAATDRLLILDDAVFSVIGPEGAAAILGRDSGRAAEYAPLLGMTAPDLARLGVVDGVVTAHGLRQAIVDALNAARPGDRAARHDAVTAAWVR
ncbi:MAG TPA: carboxyl transferase domain-containing protein [Acidimicrobiales bacterium]|nr:carboxyl transferase domain-containing protein [Acidimicrobiales bacterium]